MPIVAPTAIANSAPAADWCQASRRGSSPGTRRPRGRAASRPWSRAIATRRAARRRRRSRRRTHRERPARRRRRRTGCGEAACSRRRQIGVGAIARERPVPATSSASPHWRVRPWSLRPRARPACSGRRSYGGGDQDEHGDHRRARVRRSRIAGHDAPTASGRRRTRSTARPRNRTGAAVHGRRGDDEQWRREPSALRASPRHQHDRRERQLRAAPRQCDRADGDAAPAAASGRAARVRRSSRTEPQRAGLNSASVVVLSGRPSPASVDLLRERPMCKPRPTSPRRRRRPQSSQRSRPAVRHPTGGRNHRRRDHDCRVPAITNAQRASRRPRSTTALSALEASAASAMTGPVRVPR